MKKALFPKTGKTYDGTIVLADTGGKYVNYRISAEELKNLNSKQNVKGDTDLRKFRYRQTLKMLESLFIKYNFDCKNLTSVDPSLLAYVINNPVDVIF